jgi:hypothetical protein
VKRFKSSGKGVDPVLTKDRPPSEAELPARSNGFQPIDNRSDYAVLLLAGNDVNSHRKVSFSCVDLDTVTLGPWLQDCAHLQGATEFAW